MIPLFLTVSVRTAGKRPIRLWLPLFVLWILLAPFLALLVLATMVLGVIAGMNPAEAVWRVFAALCALPGTHVEVEAPDATVLVHIS